MSILIGYKDAYKDEVNTLLYACMRVPSNPTRPSLHIRINPCYTIGEIHLAINIINEINNVGGHGDNGANS